MNHKQFLLDEYRRHHQNPVYCTIAGQKLVVPLSYDGQVDKFLDDIFANNEEAKKYNIRDGEDVSLLKIGDIYVVAPVNLLQKGLPEAEIAKKCINKALRRYKSAIKKVSWVQKRYPKETFLASMSSEYISFLNQKELNYIARKLGNGLARAGKWSASQTVNIVAGVAGAVPAAAYHMLDKKVAFCR